MTNFPPALKARLHVAANNPYNELFAEAYQALCEMEKEIQRLEQSELSLIDERDRMEEMCDQMSWIIASDHGLELGEHSNCNCPWTNAINLQSQEDY